MKGMFNALWESVRCIVRPKISREQAIELASAECERHGIPRNRWDEPPRVVGGLLSYSVFPFCAITNPQVWITVSKRDGRILHSAPVAREVEPEIVRGILAHEIWLGMTTEQLKASRGDPSVIQPVSGGEEWRYFKSDDNLNPSTGKVRILISDGVVKRIEKR